MKNPCIISKKEKLKGEDGYKVFSVRIKEKTANALEDIASQTDRSRNEIINRLLEYAIQNCEIHG